MDTDMKLSEVLKTLIERAENREEDYLETCKAIALIFPRRLKAQLSQLVRGPVWDGDVMCKAQRGELFEMGIAIRVCCKGEQGYTGSKYIGYSILREIEDLDKSKGSIADEPRSA